MNMRELIKAVAEHAGTSQAEASKHLTAFVDIVRKTVADGDSVSIHGFGVFKPQARKSRLGYNPRTGEKMEIPARMVPVFTPGKTFKAMVEK